LLSTSTATRSMYSSLSMPAAEAPL
jgi:hypothetical protein